MIVLTQYIKAVPTPHKDTPCKGCCFSLAEHTVCSITHLDSSLLDCAVSDVIFEIVSECVQQTDDE